jgi:hypothetical protein
MFSMECEEIGACEPDWARPADDSELGRGLWAAGDLKTLKSRAGKDSVESIAKNLKRSPSAVRQKATSLGISLRARSR